MLIHHIMLHYKTNLSEDIQSVNSVSIRNDNEQITSLNIILPQLNYSNNSGNESYSISTTIDTNGSHHTESECQRYHIEQNGD